MRTTSNKHRVHATNINNGKTERVEFRTPSFVDESAHAGSIVEANANGIYTINTMNEISSRLYLDIS